MAASNDLIESLSRVFNGRAVLVTLPDGPSASAADFDRWIADAGDVRAVIMESLAPAAGLAAGGFAGRGELLCVRALAQRTRAAARAMVARRSGHIVCVVRHPVSADLPNTAVCEATSAFVRSAACDLRRYGVPVFGIVIVADGGPEAVRPMAVAAQLAQILTTGHAADLAGEVYLVTSTELGRVAPPTAETELARSDRRLQAAEVASALAAGLDPSDCGPSVRRGTSMAGIMTGRVAIVTGGGGGIGRSVATGLAAEGAAVVVADLGCDVDGVGRDPGPARAVADGIQEQGGRAIAVCADVCLPRDCRDLVRRAIEEFGRVDALCHAAGVVREALVLEFTDQEWDSVLDVHVAAAQNLTRSCLEPMRRQGYGRIVLFSSRSVAGSPGQAVYAVAKGAILAFGRSLAGQLAGSGVCVNIVFPSGRTRASMPGPVSARRRRIELMRARHHGIAEPLAYRDSPQQDPDNNAAMISWLCSENAAAVSGRIFGTGGWHVDLYRHTVVTKAITLPEVLTAEDVLALSDGRSDS